MSGELTLTLRVAHQPQRRELLRVQRTEQAFDQMSITWRRLYVPQVGHAVCCNFGCWHCGQFARAAAVVFHMLRRERVFERDIFRFGTGTR
jgi:hypothetical protein